MREKYLTQTQRDLKNSKKIQTQKKLIIVGEAISTAFQSYIDLFQFDYKMTVLLRNSGGIPRICHP